MSRKGEHQSHCKRGHPMVGDNVRIRKNGVLSCRSCERITNRVWSQVHQEQHRALKDAWYAANPERRKQLQLRWYEANRALHLERSKAWSAANPDKKRAYRRSRRARIVNAQGQAPPEKVAERMAFHGYLCVYCGGPFEEVDHAIPLDRGGSNWPANLVPACITCNRQKHTDTIWEFLDRKGEKVH